MKPLGEQDPRPKHFREMGLYNSGTNLLRELLTRNFRAELTDPRKDLPETVDDCKFWKHSSLTVLRQRKPHLLRGCGAANLTGIAIIRNPLSWLTSFKRIAYDLGKCNQGGDWLTRPCKFPSGTPEDSLWGKEYPNVETIWSSWVRDYEALPSFGFKRSVVVRYEDLVLDAEAVLTKIASVAGLALPEEWESIEYAVHPSPVDKKNSRKRAIDHIRNKNYMSSLSQEALKQMCTNLDREVMRRHGYTDCDELGF